MSALRWVPAALLVLPLALWAPVAPAQAATPRCQGEPATIVGSKGADRLVGTRRADVIVGRGGGDRIDGGRGADVICGGRGADRLNGGRGADRIRGGTDRRVEGPAGSYLVGDVLTGGPGDDTLAGGVDRRDSDHVRRPDTFSWADARRPVTVDLSGGGPGTAVGSGQDTLVLGRAQGIVGSPYADKITGSPSTDRIDGGAGGDRIRSGRGADLVYPDGPRRGEHGNDVVDAGRGADVVSSLTGRDRIDGRGGDDFVEAFSPDPTVVRLGTGNDYLGQNVTPGTGARADGGRGDDVVTFYGDLLRGQQPAARFVVDERDGTTRASGSVRAVGTITAVEGLRFVGPLRWGYFGSAGNDRVWAIGGGPLSVRTYRGNDRITGSDRDDVIDGGRGTDTGYGRGGRDECRSIERGDC